MSARSCWAMLGANALPARNFEQERALRGKSLRRGPSAPLPPSKRMANPHRESAAVVFHPNGAPAWNQILCSLDVDENFRLVEKKGGANPDPAAPIVFCDEGPRFFRAGRRAPLAPVATARTNEETLAKTIRELELENARLRLLLKRLRVSFRCLAELLEPRD